MKKTDQVVTCGKCGEELDESSDHIFELRNPCPKCGSASRQFKVLLKSELLLKSKLGIKGRRGGKGKPFIEIVVGDDLFRKLGKWMRLERTIDRESDLYEEKIIDPETNEVIHDCKEPLSQHIGHGSAKAKDSTKT